MAYTVRKNKIWLIGVFALIVVCGVFLGWQHIYAQSNPTESPPIVEAPPPGSTDAGATAGAPAAAAVITEPPIGFGQVVHSGITVRSKKNWDGRIFSTLKFKYKTVDGRTLTVILPSEYKAEKRTKAGWETLFVVYAMDVEIAQDIADSRRPPDLSSRSAGMLMLEILGYGGNRSAPEIISATIEEKSKAYLPSMGMGNINMPIMLPGMP